MPVLLCLSCQQKREGLTLGQAALPCSCCSFHVVTLAVLQLPGGGRAGHQPWQRGELKVGIPAGSPLSPTPGSSFAGTFGRPAPFPKDITVQVLAWPLAWPSPLCRADL